MVNIIEMLLTNHNRPKKKLIKLKGLVIHYTANTNKGSDADNNRNFFNTTKSSASAHYVIDDKQIIKCIPDNEIGYHVGAKSYTKLGITFTQGTLEADGIPFYSPNYFTVGVEMCVNSDGNWNKTYQNTVEFSAEFLKEHGLTIDNLYRHYDITSKPCPLMMINETEWNKFKNAVNKILNPTVSTKQGKVLVSLNIRKINSTTSAIVGKLNKNDIVTILEENNGWYRIDKGWIYSNSGKYVEIIVEKPIEKVEESKKEETKIETPIVPEKKYKYYKQSLTHVVEVDPMALKISVQDKPANTIALSNFVTSGFQMEQADKTKLPIYATSDSTIQNGLYKCYPLGILVSEGHIIQNRQPHGKAAGTLIVYKNGKVECKPVLNLLTETDYKNIWFAVSGCSILPNVRMSEEGFMGKFSDIGRSVIRPVIGYNPATNKIVIAVRPDSNITRGQQTLKNMGCSFGITLDAGGSTVLKVDNKTYVNTTRRLFSVITW